MEDKMNYNLKYIPSNSGMVIEKLKGSRIKKMTRFSSWPLDVVEQRLSLEKKNILSYTEGPALLELHDGYSVAISTDDTLNSILLWVEPLKDEFGEDEFLVNDTDYYPIDFNDSRFSNVDWKQVLDSEIIGIETIKSDSPTAIQEALPNENAIKILLANSKSIYFGFRTTDKAIDLIIKCNGQN